MLKYVLSRLAAGHPGHHRHDLPDFRPAGGGAGRPDCADDEGAHLPGRGRARAQGDAPRRSRGCSAMCATCGACCTATSANPTRSGAASASCSRTPSRPTLALTSRVAAGRLGDRRTGRDHRRHTAVLDCRPLGDDHCPVGRLGARSSGSVCSSSMFFGWKLGWLPISGFKGPEYLIMPAIVLGRRLRRP